MQSQSDLQVLESILEQARSVVPSDPDRAVSLLDSARALTDVLLQVESQERTSEGLENWG